MAGLSGLKAIADYARRSENTIRKLIKSNNFPAVQIHSTWESDTELIDKWRVRCILGKDGGRV